MEENNKNMQFEDVYSDSSKEKEKPTYQRGHKPLDQREICYPNKFVEFLLKNNKRNTKIILAAMIILVLLMIGALVAVFIQDKLDLINIEGEDEVFTGDENYSEKFEDEDFEAMHEVSNAASLDDLLKKWYQMDGSNMSQDYVINVLLIGIDGRNGVKYGGNSDVLMLVSINRKTETITLCSFMRDSRTYFEANGRSYWTKVNATYSRGGATTTIDTLERDYKIDIDYYVAVDFTSFPKVIDALGGVTVDMKEYEQRYINRTTTAIKKIPNYGPVKLDGKQALVYARIRKCDADSDVSRTRRQRTLITAIINSAKGASLTQLNNAVDTLLPLLATDCSRSQILSYGAQALAQGWLNYEIKQVTMPDEDTRKGAMINGISYWVVDYPLAAQRVQLALYGTTNIELDEYRDSALDYVKFNNNGSSNSSDSTESNAGNDNGVGYTEETTTRRGILDWWKPDSDDETTTGASEEIPSGDEPASKGEETTTAPSEQPPAEETTTSKNPFENIFNQLTTTQPAA